MEDSNFGPASNWLGHCITTSVCWQIIFYGWAQGLFRLFFRGLVQGFRRWRMSEPFDAAGLLPLRWPEQFYASRCRSGEIGIRTRLKIWRGSLLMSVRVRPPAPNFFDFLINWRIRINRVQTASQMLISGEVLQYIHGLFSTLC